MPRNILRLCGGLITPVLLLALMASANAGDKPEFVKPPESNRLFTLQDNLQERVQEIVDEKCAFAGCHTGANAPKGLDLSEEMLVANLVGVKSADGPWLRVKPSEPANSYLMKKVMGAPGIKGDRMPRGGRPLSDQEIAAFVAWIKSLPAGMKAQPAKMKYAAAFPGVTLANLQTAETLEKGAFLYRIAHKFNAPVNTGFDNLFGLDGGSSMLTQLGFPLSNSFLVTMERSKVNATFEFGAKYRFLRQTSDNSTPISAAIYAGVDWATAKAVRDPADVSQNPKFLSRTAGERFAIFAQLPFSKQIGNRLSLLAVPGILLNGNVTTTDENPLVTIGLAGRIALSQKYSLFAEIIPVISGDETAATVPGRALNNGNLVFYDTFAAGLEIKAGGHVFHLFISNSAGNTTNQYMSGGDFDITTRRPFTFVPDFRLGFNIYRVLNYPL
jgi:hypothetical protein